MGSLLGDEEASSETTQAPVMTEQQRKLLKQLMKQFQGQTEEVTSLPDEYEGPFAAPLTNLQSMSLSAIENLSMQMSDSGVYMAGTDALTKQLQTGGKQDITDVFTNSVVNPMTKKFKEDILPEVFGNFSGTGAYGSDRMKALGKATDDFGLNVLNAGSKLSYDAGDAANKNILQALGLLPTVTGAPIQNNIAALAAGSIEQGTNQLGIDNFLNYQNTRQNQKAQQLQAMIAALGLKDTENITTVDPGSSKGSSIIGAGIGAAATIF